MRDTTAGRKKRGQTSTRYESQYVSLSNPKLLVLLNDENAQKRTIAAKLLGGRKFEKAIPFLCKRLEQEKALYTRIAISEALAAIGESALVELINLLGKIGNNQHHELPKKGFYKKSYPLPRDIVARTIVKIGRPALKPLEEVITNGDRRNILEAIDGIGHIAFYSNDIRSEEILITTYRENSSDLVVQWKIVRALQSFPTEKVKRLLATIIYGNISPELRWEAVRSMGQLECKVSADIIACAKQDIHPEVRKMARTFL